jgi:hypothetical protein
MSANLKTRVRSVDDVVGSVGRVTPRQLAHIVLKTSNYEPMIDWWLKVLDATIVVKRPNATFLTFDAEHHRLAIVNVPRLRAFDVNRCGVDHIAFTYSELPELLYTYKRLKKLGISPRWCPGGGLLMSLYYQDPDGNRAQLQWDVFATAEQLDRFQNDPNIVLNPFGAPFDPEEILAAYEAGMPVEDIVKIPRYPEGMGLKNIMDEMGIGEVDVEY